MRLGVFRVILIDIESGAGDVGDFAREMCVCVCVEMSEIYVCVCVRGVCVSRESMCVCLRGGVGLEKQCTRASGCT